MCKLAEPINKSINEQPKEDTKKKIRFSHSVIFILKSVFRIFYSSCSVEVKHTHNISHGWHFKDIYECNTGMYVVLVVFIKIYCSEEALKIVLYYLR